ncbi:hypothetical protein [Desertivirga xinjiangensis]|uniref:hypothetical protein n=1 Tax=Desertivirga xinjiangensis TaxID=539206 RepID=UPI00210BA1EF|nr:hypothetical protein [Pedobacter xinjiangensis]
MNTFRIFPLLVALALISTGSQAQSLLKKIKQKANEVAEKTIDKKTDELINGKQAQSGETGSNQTNNPAGAGVSSTSVNTSSGGPIRNKGGAGLVTTPPDVKENLNSAESSFKSANYGDARFALRQAILGVEMEIGQNLLKSLPESVSGLALQADKDKVTSSGWGWAGLTIHREYLKDDKQLSMTIANNSVMMNAVNLYLTNGAYAQTTGGEQKWKQTKLKGNKAVIEYDDSSGYKLTVPLGQSSLVVFEGLNFATEQDLMTAASAIDIDKIKKTLGEQ